MKKALLILTLIAISFSCKKKEPEPIVNLPAPTSANLTIKAEDKDGNGIQGAEVDVFINGNNLTGIPTTYLYDGTTGADGKADVGELLEGTYTYIIKASHDNKEYSATNSFQIIAGKDKTLVTKPLDNVGKAQVKVINQQGQPVANINVALIPYSAEINYDSPYKDLIEAAYFTGKTDAEGYITFESVPVTILNGMHIGKVYGAMAYYDHVNYSFPNGANYIYVNKESTEKLEIMVNF